MNEKNVFQRGDSDREKIGRFVAGSSLALMATVFTGTMSFVWAVVMQRLLGPKGYGLAKPFLDVFWMLSMVVSVGVPQAMQTFISHHHQNNPEESRRVMAEGTRLLLILAAAICGPAAAAIFLLRGHMTPLMLGLSWLMLAALVFRQIYFSMFGALGGIQRIDLVALCNILFPTSMMLCSVAMVLSVRRAGGSVAEDAGVLAAVSGVSIGAAIQYFASLLVGKKGGLKIRDMYRWSELRGGTLRLLSFGWVTAVALIAGSSISFITPAAVSTLAHKYGMFGPAPEINAVRAGYFSCAYTYAMAPMLIVGMLYALLPAISEAHSQGNRPLMQRYFDLAVRYALTVVFFVIAVFSSLAGPIVEFFGGPAFPADKIGPMTFTLVVGMSICMFLLLMMNLLIGLKRPGAPAVAAVVLLAVELAALWGAARVFGTVMAEALAFDSALLLGLMFLVIYITAAVGLKWNWAIPARPFAAALATALIMKLLPATAPLFLLSLAAAVPIYTISLGLLGGMDGDDFDMVREMMKAMKLGPFTGLLDAAQKLFSLSPLYKKK